MEKVSLKVIANQVGVSIATVSLVLNGKNKNGRVSAETSKRILDKAAELNYMPNSLAKGLRMGRSKSIGLIVADISNSFFGTLALHIQKYAEIEGYIVIIGNTNEELGEMEKMIRFLNAYQIDGLILVPTENSEPLIHKLIKAEIPLVLIDRTYPEISVNSIIINNFEISNIAVKQLLKKGCKNIAFITYKEEHHHINDRQRGYEEALKEEGIFNPDNILEVRYEFLKDDIKKAISTLIKRKPAIDGYFFATNSISIISVKQLLKNNIDIYNDVQIMCFDENEAYHLLPHTLPYIKQPIEEMAKKSIEIIVDKIEKRKKHSKNNILQATLITE